MNSIVLEGDFWHVCFNGKTASIKNTLGIRYIEYLIRNKGKEVHVFDLMQAIQPSDVTKTDSMLSGLTEEQLAAEGLSLESNNQDKLLDSTAKKQLQGHLKALQEQITEAHEFGDVELAEKLESEQEQILASLSSDLGLRGKSRKTNSRVEQVRKNITNRINKDKKKLAKIFPEFAEHLTFISTGTFCCYQPIPDTQWQ